MKKEKFEFSKEQLELDCKLEDYVDDLQRAEKEANRYIFICEKKIKEYQDKVKNAKERIQLKKDYIENNIIGYLNKAFSEGKLSEESIRNTKTQKSYVIPSAKFIFKKSKNKIVKNDDFSLIEYFKRNGLESYIKIKESPDWIEFKKNLEISGKDIINKDGEILKIDGINIEIENESFEIKYL